MSIKDNIKEELINMTNREKEIVIDIITNTYDVGKRNRAREELAFLNELLRFAESL